MSTYSVSEAKNQLPKLDRSRSQGGGGRHHPRGRPVAELKPVPSIAPEPRRVTEADLEWLRATRVGRSLAKTDAGTLVREMRDEEWDR